MAAQLLHGPRCLGSPQRLRGGAMRELPHPGLVVRAGARSEQSVRCWGGRGQAVAKRAGPARAALVAGTV
eukprot:6040673-Alexandrium_andersonii.AAC.1